ncbi:uncharacterized protein At5g01610-like [Tasmannia lanceolata]|uniref:uncharacterized protein At5g01610-like n=1 Tax=Tasmannia lanceolata TaxID=3420 RepID=UPI004062E80A
MGMLSWRRSITVTAFVCVLLITMAILAEPRSDRDMLTAYEVLEEYDFPIGILPKGALGYDLDRITGKFSAYLNGSCSFSLEGSYQLRYKSTITGTIAEDRLKNLKGVSVKVLFFWVNIVEVSRSGDELEFSVGIASARFSLDNFVECPQCGCGLDCIGLGGFKEGYKVRFGRPFVSSS